MSLGGNTALIPFNVLFLSLRDANRLFMISSVALTVNAIWIIFTLCHSAIDDVSEPKAFINNLVSVEILFPSLCVNRGVHFDEFP